MEKSRKEIFEFVLNRSKGRCEYCRGRGKEMHHVFGGSGKRLLLESKETVVYLCEECHRGKDSQKIINFFKIKVCRELIEKYGENEARKRCGGRIYSQ